MAEIKFYANIKDQTGDGFLINHSAGSGLGFYGANFGISVPVGSRQSSTFVTNSTGSVQGAQLNNTKMISSGTPTVPGTVDINGQAVYSLSGLPNYLCPLNIRFTHTEPVQVINCKLKIFDRNNINNHASGVTTYVYEARHPSINPAVSNLSLRGRTNHTWFEFDPAEGMPEMTLTSGPGASGLNTGYDTNFPALGATTNNGATHLSERHDWFIAISSEPITVGSKTQYGLYFTLEYL